MCIQNITLHCNMCSRVVMNGDGRNETMCEEEQKGIQ